MAVDDGCPNHESTFLKWGAIAESEASADVPDLRRTVRDPKSRREVCMISQFLHMHI
jgi:hypothetical protein